MLKDIVASISRLCEHTRNEHILIQDQARDLFSAVQAFHDEARKSGARGAQFEKSLESILKKQEQLELTFKSVHKG
jgi:DNA anti-recombination protein RmuC